jgi:hypothetical protein
MALRHTAEVKGAVAWIVPAAITLVGALVSGGLLALAQKFA